MTFFRKIMNVCRCWDPSPRRAILSCGATTLTRSYVTGLAMILRWCNKMLRHWRKKRQPWAVLRAPAVAAVMQQLWPLRQPGDLSLRGKWNVHCRGNQGSNVCVVFRYDSIAQAIPDAFSYNLEEMHRLEMDLGHLPQKWRVLWDKLELPPSETLNVSLLGNSITESELILYAG
jgi:hypothetical protein